MKKKVMVVFSEGGENGGPFTSHKRIIDSCLNKEYEFVKLIIPKGKLKVINFKLFKNLVAQIRKEKPDVIHCNGLQLQGYHCMLAAFWCRVPNRIVAIHGSSLEAISFSGLKKFILNILEHLTLLLSTAYFGVSDYTSSWKRLKKFNKKSFGTIYNLTPELQLGSLEPGKIRRELGIDSNKIVIVSTARITAEKGFDTFTQVIKQYDDPSICFIIVGDGDYLDTMRDELDDKIKNGTLHLLGYRKDILDILNDSNIFMMLTHHENLSMSMLEALKMNLPIITTNVGGNPEIVYNDVNGFLVKDNDVNEPIESIKKIVNNINIYKANCKTICEKFDTSKVLNKLRMLYNYDTRKYKTVKDYLEENGGELND